MPGSSFVCFCFFFSSRRRHTRYIGDWSSDVCSSDLRDITNKELIQGFKDITGKNFFKTPDPDQLPGNRQELDMYLQLNYKQAIEIAEEETISNIFDYNKYEETKKRLAYDLAVLGISAVKTNFNLANGITVEYVDPASLVYSYTDDPNFEEDRKSVV